MFSLVRPDRSPAVFDLDFKIYDGEIVALLGFSGSGKTSTLKAASTQGQRQEGYIQTDESKAAGGGIFLYPPEGDLKEFHARFGPRTNVMDIWQPELTRHIYRVMQNPVIIPGSIIKNLTLTARLNGIPEKEIAQRVQEALTAVGMYENVSHRLDRKAQGALSGGQELRLMIAEALVLRPRSIWLDEPTASLDPATRKLIGDTIVDGYARKYKRTLVYVTHDEELAKRADRAILFKDNRVIDDGPAAEVWDRWHGKTHAPPQRPAASSKSRARRTLVPGGRWRPKVVAL